MLRSLAQLLFLFLFGSQVLYILFKGSIFRCASRPFHLEVSLQSEKPAL